MKANRRVMLVSQFFPPDEAAVGVLLNDLAVWLVENGFEVLVVCGTTNYTGGQVPDQDRNKGHRGIVLNRIRTVQFGRGFLQRLASYANFLGASTALAISRGRDLSCVVTLTAPPGLAWIGYGLRRFFGVRHVIWEMDVYPDVATDLGMTWARLAGWFLDFPRRRADAIIVLGEDMKQRLIRRGVAERLLRICPNWADGKVIRPLAANMALEPFVILYSGNLGMAHDIETIFAVIERLRYNLRFQFVFAGGGTRREELRRRCAQFGNVKFLEWAGRESLTEHLGYAHLGLVTQLPQTVGSVVPSKIYGLLAAARPLLFIGPAASTGAMTVVQFRCGWHVECGEVERTVALLERLEADRESVVDAGRRARAAFDAHFEKTDGVRRVGETISAVVENIG